MNTSELPHEPQFGTVAVVVQRLRVGHASPVDERQLRAETKQSEGAVERRDAERAGAVQSLAAVQHLVHEAVALVVRPPHLGAGSG